MFFTGSRYIVAGVTLLIAYLGITSQIFVFVPWLRTISISATLAALVPFNLGVAIIYWHYYLACTTNPGSPPPGWGNPEEIREKSSERVAGIGHTDGNLEATSGQSTAVQSTHGAVNPATATTTGPSMELRDRSLRSDISPSPIDPIGHDSTTSPQSTTTAVATAPKKKNMGPLPRYCRSCEAFKPPRSHHCRICKKCVLKMDHHCPWINNCVGHYNYGHFIRFVTWVTITTSYCMILLIARVWDAIKFENYYRYSGDGPTKVQTGFLVINVFVDGGVLIAVGILCIYHLWSMISNTSTIEVWEREKVDAMIKKGKMQKVKYPYDVGCVKNYKQVLGHKPWLWFLWPHPLVDSGTEFEVIQDKHAAKIWPPREYRTTKYKNQTFVSEYTTSAKQGRVHGAREKGRDDEDERTQNRKDGSRSSIYPTHVRRGSEGWVVQDLTIQQRAQLYDLQSNYEHEHPDSQGLDDTRDIEQQEEEYQEGLSDIEGES
ncbi:Palmitoyltransferase, partial [Lunasporangiospora selenospora]